MRKPFALLLAFLALGLVFAACGDDDDSDSGEGSATTEEPADSGGDSGSGGGGGAEVGMENIQFTPSEITVNAGDTITFTNDEAVPHDVEKTSGPGPAFSSGPQGGMGEGDTYQLKLDEPGTYEYVCRVHAPGMSGTITVK
jgi:plastocyanin